MTTAITRFNGAHFFLSNFHPVGVYLDEHRYASVEHAYQAAKTLDERQRQQIRSLAANKANIAKRLGESVKLRDDWEQVKQTYMRNLVQQKFKISWFAERLMNTGTLLLVEGNTWHDNYWGSCECAACIHLEGQNWLGKILMEERSKLQSCRR